MLTIETKSSAKVYARKIDNAVARLAAMVGPSNQERTFLALVDVSINSKPGLREKVVSAADAAKLLSEGTALRVSVMNAERSVAVFVDP